MSGDDGGGGRREVKGIIYDLDGTLIDTETLSTEGIQAVVQPFGKTFTWATKKKILGLRGEEWGKIVIDDLGLEGQLSPAELVRQWEEYLDHHSPNIKKMPGALSITQYFARLGIPQAIATSSSMDLVQHKRLKHGDLFGHMAVVVCGNDPEVVRGKPNPDIYLVAARRLGIPPENCLVFEDAYTGVCAGKAAGMRVVAVPDKQLDPTTFHNVADEVLTSLEDFSPSHWGFPDKSCNGIERHP